MAVKKKAAKKTAAVAAVGVPWIVPRSVLGGTMVAPSDRIVLGAIGIGPRGRYVLGCMLNEPDVQFVAVCDVRAGRREHAKRSIDAKYRNRDCTAYRGLRNRMSILTEAYAYAPYRDRVLCIFGPR